MFSSDSLLINGRLMDQLRTNIRNMYYPATKQEILKGMEVYEELGNNFGVKCLQELLDEFHEGECDG